MRRTTTNRRHSAVVVAVCECPTCRTHRAGRARAVHAGGVRADPTAGHRPEQRPSRMWATTRAAGRRGGGQG